MKAALLAVLVASLAWGDEPVVLPVLGPPVPIVPVLDVGVVPSVTPNDAPLVTLPDGTLARGTTVKLTAGTPAPFTGRLIDNQEMVRRERINERNAHELQSLTQPSNVTLTKSQLFVIVLSSVAAGAATTGMVVGGWLLSHPQPQH